MNVATFIREFDYLANAPNGVKKLREMILQLAVQGKLVLQDPDDEPVERISMPTRPGAHDETLDFNHSPHCPLWPLGGGP